MMRKSLIVVFVIFGIHSIEAENSTTLENSNVVQTKLGLLEGKLSKSRNGNVFHEFLGIPYGTVKVRFQPAVEHANWEGIKKATEYGSQCIQVSFVTNKTVGKDDCLFLNVFTTKLNPTEKFPVMVFIHGGGFFMGNSGEYGPKYIIDHNVVLVTLNYRLGPFGFLNAGIEEAGGNMGLKDQVLALNWVKENIEKFGGDSSRVTIFGESAGALAVSYLTLSPLAKGLFHNAISQSGTALDTVSFENNPLREAKKLANSVDCPTSNIKYMVECLRKIEPEYIMKNIKCDFMLEDTAVDRSYTSQFFPSVETYSDESVSKKFLPQCPYKILKDGNFKPVPYIIGLNDVEGLAHAGIILSTEKKVERINEEWGSVAPSILGYRDKAKDKCVISSEIRKFYFNNQKISNETEEALEQMYTDRGFLHPAKLFVSLYSKHAPTYLYNFTFRGNYSFTDMLQIPRKDPDSKRPCHFDEIQYQFSDVEGIPAIEKESPFYSFSEKFLRLWSTFAKNGIPSDALMEEGNEQWLPVNLTGTNSEPQWFQIDKTSRMIDEHPDITKRYQFWDKLPLLENGNIYKAEKKLEL